jgi:nitrogen fixation NifU-like protein
MPSKVVKKFGVYTQKVIEHFRNPRNYGRLKNPGGIGKVGNIVCGDIMWLYIKIGKNKIGQETIKDVSFETFGCVAALATSSAVTELAKGKTIKQALKISQGQLVKKLGSLPPVKLHCSVLAADALAEAIYDYLSKNKKPIPPELRARHERIQKDKEIIEDRYQDWLKLEEKMHRGS